MEKLIAKGAEADLILRDWNGKKVLVKKRNPKKYRHPRIDQHIRRSRTNHEADIIHRAKQAGVSTPSIYQVNIENAVIVMEYIDGIKIRDIVDRLNYEEQCNLFKRIGLHTGVLHKKGIIHGDLTTSNIIKQDKRIVFIDFGLAENSYEIEKRAVDLNLMKRMLTSTHYRYQKQLLEAFIEGYKETMMGEANEIIERMKEVAKRGRYIEKI